MLDDKSHPLLDFLSLTEQKIGNTSITARKLFRLIQSLYYKDIGSFKIPVIVLLSQTLVKLLNQCLKKRCCRSQLKVSGKSVILVKNAGKYTCLSRYRPIRDILSTKKLFKSTVNKTIDEHLNRK